MLTRSRGPRILAQVVAVLCLSAAVRAYDVRVMTSGAFTEACTRLAPAFEQATGHHLVLIFGASMGSGVDTIPSRLSRHDAADVVILARSSLDELAARGFVIPESRVDLVRSRIGMAVRTGAPRPDISSPEKLKSALLAARSVSYSTGASGMHFVKVLERLGIADAVAAKRIAPRAGELVGAVVARGEADIGVQQLSELLPVSGIEILDPLPAELQQTIVYGATAFPQATQRQAAQAFVGFLRSETARAVLRKKGLDPA